MNMTNAYILRDRRSTDSHYVCSQCDNVLTIAVEESISDGRRVLCQMCGCDINVLDTNVILDEQYSHVHNDVKRVKNMRWYHISEYDEGCMDFDTENTMHIGRLSSLEALVRQRTVWNTGWEPFFIYELRIKDNTLLGDTILRDNDDWYDVEGDIYYGCADGYVYVNRFESPGSISVLLKRNCVELVKSWENEFPQ